MLYVSAAFLVLSGIASLTYQVAWVRLIGLSLGSTSASISTVLSAFFLGLALGSFLAERITRGRLNSLAPYLVLEAVVGLAGLGLLPILLNLDQILSWAPAFGTNLQLKFALSVILLAIPTTCMGATFPVMAAILIRRSDDLGARLSMLYSLNTFGAVLGAAMSGFLFIPLFGLDGAVKIAVALNMTVVALGWIVSRTWALDEKDERPAPAKTRVAAIEAAPFSWIAASALIVTGFAAIATQIGWTKFLSIFIGSTIHGFSAILTVFLLGLAAGSWAMKNWLDRIRSPEAVMAIGLAVLGVFLLLTRSGLSVLPDAERFVTAMQIGDGTRQMLRYGAVLVLIFPPTFVFGALFPLSLRLYCGGLAGIQARVGEAYAINTVASIFGAIVAGFWIIPVYGTDILLFAVALGVTIFALVFLARRANRETRILVAGVSVAAVAVAVVLPKLDYARLISSVEYSSEAKSGKKPDFLFLREGKAGVISLVSYDGKYARVQNNGLNESKISLTDKNDALLTETLLGILPYVLHRDPKSAFMLGYGGGVTTRALTLTDLDRIKVVELEPSVVEASRTIPSGPASALKDPRVDLVFNDARNTLLVEREKYDLIVSQPSHPWLAGSANVFTQDFWQIARGQMNPGGVFAQWISLFRMDAATLESLLKAFYNVFPEGVSFINSGSGDLILIGSTAKIEFDYARIDKALADPRIAAVLASKGIVGTQDLLWYFCLSRDEALAAAGSAIPNTDTNLLSEVRLSSISEPTGADDPYELLRRNFSFDVAPYLGPDAADKLASLSAYFLDWNNYTNAGHAADRLAAIDPMRGRTAAYERLQALGDFSGAATLYGQYEDWPDQVHIEQAQLFSGLDLVNDAWVALSRAAPGLERDAAEAELRYAERDLGPLRARSSKSDGVRKYYLLARAETDLAGAGPLLADDFADSDDIGVLRALLRYRATQDDQKAIDRAATRLARAVRTEARRYVTGGKLAAGRNDLRLARAAYKAAAGLDPDTDGLDELRARINKGSVASSQ
jgi:spermidine synthase